MCPTRAACTFCKTSLLVLFLACLVLNNMFTETQAGQRYCGRDLTYALNLLCKDGYKAKLSKRTGEANKVLTLHAAEFGMSPSADNSTKNSFAPGAIETASVPFLSHFLNSGMMATQTQRRQRRRIIGAYDECCLKSCEVTEMMDYCYVP